MSALQFFNLQLRFGRFFCIIFCWFILGSAPFSFKQLHVPNAVVTKAILMALRLVLIFVMLIRC